jgi:hypothetical protein
MIFLDPAILFFLFGVIAGLLKSNLQIPDSITKFLGIYLLMSLGWRAGAAVNDFAYSLEMILALSIAISFSLILPLMNFLFLKKFINIYDSAALAATYGSCGAITYLAGTQYLRMQKVTWDDYMISCMIAMQIPALVLSVILCSMLRKNQYSKPKQIIFEAFTDGSIFVLLAAFIIGCINPDYEVLLAGGEEVQPFKLDVFRILLSIFMLDMGIQASKNLSKFPKQAWFLCAYAIFIPFIHALIAYFVCSPFHFSTGNLFLLMLLAASANYIAVPAVMKSAIPEANPGLYLGMSLGISFPLTIFAGIPLYYYLATC